jgi:acetoin utilization deacetylase AcuC-like enzyme
VLSDYLVGVVVCRIQLGSRSFQIVLILCLQVAKTNFVPELIVYNAGTDILDGDPLGRLKVMF